MSTPTPQSGAANSRPLMVVLGTAALLVVAFFVVVGAMAFRELRQGQDFILQFPGRSQLPATAPVGFPAWVQWQHFLNSFFILFIIRTGWQLRSKKRPAAFWTRKNDGLIKTKSPPVRIGLPLWFHLGVDILWVLNGIVFYVLVFVTGQWMRLVPLNWDIVPNAISAGIQYASLDWPTEDGWVNYNALQTLTYFVTVFIAAPLALATGIRLAPGLAARFRPLDRVIPVKAARAVHVAVMIWFVGFIIVHVTLVLATGALRNLNHIYAGRDDASWWGFAIFAASIVIMVVAWNLARPTVLAAIAGKTGTVRR